MPASTWHGVDWCRHMIDTSDRYGRGPAVVVIAADVAKHHLFVRHQPPTSLPFLGLPQDGGGHANDKAVGKDQKN
jgi:hypothetical protein